MAAKLIADGVELQRELRSVGSTREVPLIMLFTKAEIRDRIRGIPTSACDYVGKPHPDRDVVMQIRPNLRAHADWGLMRVLLDNLMGNACTMRQNFQARVLDWPRFSVL